MGKPKFNKEKYLKHRGNICPYCNSKNIEAHRISGDCDYARGFVDCHNCDKTWKDIYILTDVEEIERRVKYDTNRTEIK